MVHMGPHLESRKGQANLRTIVIYRVSQKRRPFQINSVMIRRVKLFKISNFNILTIGRLFWETLYVKAFFIHICDK